MANCIFETYKSFVMPHVRHVFHTASDNAIETMCEHLSSNYALPHWKFIFCCCAQCPCMGLPGTESDRQKSNVISISHCTVHGRLTFNEKKQCQFCETSIY